jgi:hypothetical protein
MEESQVKPIFELIGNVSRFVMMPRDNDQHGFVTFSDPENRDKKYSQKTLNKCIESLNGFNIGGNAKMSVKENIPKPKPVPDHKPTPGPKPQRNTSIVHRCIPGQTVYIEVESTIDLKWPQSDQLTFKNFPMPGQNQEWKDVNITVPF